MAGAPPQGPNQGGGYQQQGGGYPQQQGGGYPQQQQPYGQQGYPPQGYGNPNAGKIPGTVIAGFILAFLCPLIGLILCAVGLGEAKRRGAGEGLAIAGIVISLAWLLLSVGINLASM